MRASSPFLFILSLAFVFLNCTESPLPPEASFETSGLVRDSDGIWIDTLTDEAFSDMPLPFRGFNRYCSDCHSDRGLSPLADSARMALRINTWRDAIDFGTERLVVAAKLGNMPPDSSSQVPGAIMDQVEAYLASWSAGNP